MGSGKTSATIAYINANPEKRFLYITPYLPEAARIQECCPDANFAEPSSKLPQYGFSKAQHALALIEEGRNIASTHQAVVFYTDQTVEALRKSGYTLIIDEQLNILQKDIEASGSDLKMAVEAGYVRESESGRYELTEKAKEYDRGKFSYMFRMMESRQLVYINDAKRSKSFSWLFSDALIRGLDEVIVLTYLFHGSEMETFLKMYDIPYTNIGLRRTPEGGYEFTDHDCYIPDYVRHLDELIQIEQSERMNRIGEDRTALSMEWYRKSPEELVDQLRKNLSNYFRNRMKGSEASDRMCATYKDYWGKIRSGGFWNSNVVFTQKSSNSYRDRSVLAYPVNLFVNAGITRFYKEHGQSFDQDRYALSTMVQWVWRSAIRDGKPINIYIPSKRMRTLFTDWMKGAMKGEIA